MVVKSFPLIQQFKRKIQCGLKNPTRSASTSTDLRYVLQHYKVHRRGDDEYGSREYLLVAPDCSLEDAQKDESLKAAALLAHRNIVFGARSFQDFSVQDVCVPLVDIAVRDAAANGEQPQAIASLAGLSKWVQDCISSQGSLELEALRKTDPDAFEAVKAIATGIPREGHSVVGIGTYRDGEEGWKRVSTEFVELGLSEEANLYKNHGARFVGIEHLADKNPEYLASAGGAMVRLFFL